MGIIRKTVRATTFVGVGAPLAHKHSKKDKIVRNTAAMAAGVQQLVEAQAQAAGIVEAKGFNGRVAFDGDTVAITRKGLIAREAGPSLTISLDAIADIQWKDAGVIRNGYVRFAITHDGLVDPARDPHTVTFTSDKQPAFERLTRAVRQALDTHPEPATTPQGPPPDWYNDPHGHAEKRWWDGTAWTDHTR
jgi:hypothetical protein